MSEETDRKVSVGKEGGKKPRGEKMGVCLGSRDRTLGADGEKAGAKPLPL